MALPIFIISLKQTAVHPEYIYAMSMKNDNNIP